MTGIAAWSVAKPFLQAIPWKLVSILAAVGLVLAFGWHFRGAKADADIADLKRRQADAYAMAMAQVRIIERRYQTTADKAFKDYRDELATLRAARNPGLGAPVRVCAASAAGHSPAAGAGPGADQVTPAAGLVPPAVPDGPDVGPVLRLLVATGDELSAQTRGLLAACPHQQVIR